MMDIYLAGGVMAFNLWVARFGMWPYTLVSLPSTIAHELSHYCAAKLLFASPAFPTLLPRRVPGGWVLGSVAFHATIFNRIPVALSPLLLLPAAIWMMTNWMPTATGMNYLLDGWAAGNLLQACLPSRHDWKIALPALVVGVGVLAAIALFGGGKLLYERL
jgi:hypothetical protein